MTLSIHDMVYHFIIIHVYMHFNEQLRINPTTYFMKIQQISVLHIIIDETIVHHILTTQKV